MDSYDRTSMSQDGAAAESPIALESVAVLSPKTSTARRVTSVELTSDVSFAAPAADGVETRAAAAGAATGGAGGAGTGACWTTAGFSDAAAVAVAGVGAETCRPEWRQPADNAAVAKIGNR